MKNIINQYNNHTTIDGKNILQEMVEENPKVFNPSDSKELYNLQHAVVQMTNYITEDDEELNKIWETLISVYNYFDEMEGKKRTPSTLKRIA